MTDESSKVIPNTKNINSTIDPSNPYFFHPSDQPGHLLVSTKLNGLNYSSWSKSIIHALTAKNKIGFIDGSIQPPSEIDKPAEYAIWNQCNSMILSWLTHAVEPDLAKGVIHAKSAQQVWEDFKDQFSQKNAPTVYKIKKALSSLTQGSMTVSAYFTKIKGLWDELEAYQMLTPCNQMKAHNDQREEDRLMQFLMGLNDTYSTARSNILMMSPLPNVRQAYSLINQDEAQQQVSIESTDFFSIAAAIQGRTNKSSNNSRNKHCDHCNRDGHTIENCRTLKFHCNFCDKDGHTEDRCKYKDGTWVLNNTSMNSNRQNQSQQQHRKPRNNFSSAANATNTSQSSVCPSNTQDSSKPLFGLSTEQLQQLAQAISMMSLNHAPGNSNVHANATGLEYEEDDWLG